MDNARRWYTWGSGAARTAYIRRVPFPVRRRIRTRRFQLSAAGTAFGGVLLLWLARRLYRWRTSEPVVFRGRVGRFFREEALEQYNKRHRNNPPQWLGARLWELRRESLRIGRLVPRMVDEFGASTAHSREILIQACPRAQKRALEDWRASGESKEKAKLWIEKGIGEPPPVALCEGDFLKIAPQLAFTKRVCEVAGRSTAMEVSFTLPLRALFGKENSTGPSAHHSHPFLRIPSWPKI